MIAILAFSLVLLVCLTGWGWIFRRLLEATLKWTPRGPMSSLGLATILALCGPLNALHGLTKLSFAVLSGIGFLGFAAGIPRWLAESSPIGAQLVRKFAVGLLAMALALPAMTSFLASPRFNHHDDGHAYMVAVKRVLDTGTIGSDPFNFRLAVSGAGAIACLQAAGVALFGWRAIWAVDHCVGTMLLIAALIWLGGRRKVPWPMVAAMLVGFFSLAVRDIANVTSYYLTLALLVALYGVVTDREAQPLGSGICVGLLLAGLAALKNPPVPMALALVAATVIRHHRSDWRRAARQAAPILVAFCLPMAIWYLPHYGRDAVLVPLVHGSGFDQVSVPYSLWWIFTVPDRLMALGYLASLIAIGALLICALRKTSEFREAIALLSSVAVGCIATTWLTGGMSLTRFNRPHVIFACWIAGVLLGAHPFRHRLQRVFAVLAVAGALALCRNGSSPLFPLRDYVQAWASLSSSIPRSPFASSLEAANRLQAALEPGSSALIWMDRPFLLDFARNRFNVVDFPYAISPFPGVGECRDAQCLTSFLVEKSVRYVVYSYGNEAGFPAAMLAERFSDPHFTPWQRALNRRVPEWKALLRELIGQRGTVFDDGRTAVVDLRAAPMGKLRVQSRQPASLPLGRPERSTGVGIDDPSYKLCFDSPEAGREQQNGFITKEQSAVPAT